MIAIVRHLPDGPGIRVLTIVSQGSEGGLVKKSISRPEDSLASLEKAGMVQKRVTAQGWLGSTSVGQRPQIRGHRAEGSLAVASSTPATQSFRVISGLAIGPPAGVGDGLRYLRKR